MTVVCVWCEQYCNYCGQRQYSTRTVYVEEFLLLYPTVARITVAYYLLASLAIRAFRGWVGLCLVAFAFYLFTERPKTGERNNIG
jgi:hypothetical protein